MSVIQETLRGYPESGYLFAGVLKRLLARGLARLFQQGLQSMQGSVGTVQRGGEHVRPQ